MEVVAGVGDGEGDGPAPAGLGIPENLWGKHAGGRRKGGWPGDGWWRGDGLGPGSGEAGHALVGRQVRQRGELGDRHEVTAPQASVGEDLGGVAQATAVEAVPAGEE